MPPLPRPKPPRPYAALPIGWAVVILLLTLMPSANMPVTPEWELLAFDTAAHAGVFGLLAWLSWFSLRRQQRWPRLAHHPEWAVLLGCFLFGGLIELLQTTMHMGRRGDVKDLIGDTLGAALALGVAWALRRYVPAASALLLLAGTVAASRPAEAQDLPRARQTIRTLAAENMHGRGYVQHGEHLAAAYLRGRLRALKLEPLAPDYTQPFTLDVNTFPGKMSVSWQPDVPPGTNCFITNWIPGRDFIAAPNSSGGSVLGRLHALDTAIFTSQQVQQWYRNQSFQGQVVWLRQADAKRLETLQLPVRQHLDSAAAWITAVPKLTASLAPAQAPTPRIEVLETRTPQWKTTTQRYGPLTVTPANGYLLASIRLDAQLQRNYPTQNLAAVVRGTAQPDSFLVVSAHYDHLGTMGKDVYFPGANDNASGVALLLELAAHYARPENRPACSVAFLLFGAEEAGLVGSQYFVAHPLLPLKRIKFLVNLDLLGTGEQGATVVNGRVFEAPYRRLVVLNDAHHYLPALGARGRAANSDHFPFSEAGVPAFFLYTRGGSPAYHDVNDRPEALSLAGFAGAFGLVRDFLNEEGAAPK